MSLIEKIKQWQQSLQQNMIKNKVLNEPITHIQNQNTGVI